VREPGRSQPDLGVFEAEADLTEHRLRPDHNVVEVQVRVAAGDGPVNGVDRLPAGRRADMSTRTSLRCPGPSESVSGP
jgi:hypothetical protein